MNPLQKKKVLVVGGAGFIGSHMALMLRDSGYAVTVFDNFSRGHADVVPPDELVAGDLCNQHDLQRLFHKGHFDLVMHFAGLAEVGESVRNPELYYRNNVTGTLNLLAQMRDSGVGRIVFSSSCATYGNPRQIPMREDHPQHPVNPYGTTKFIVERALADFAAAYDLQSISLRYFNAAGCDPSGLLGERHDPETHLIPLVLREACRISNGGDPAATELCVFGNDFDTRDGTCVRDYIHVRDLCAAHLAAADRLLAGSGNGADALNLGNGRGYTVLEVIEACRRVTGRDIRYRVVGRRAGDPASLVADAGRAGAELQWTPTIPDLEEMVRTAWNWLRRFCLGI